MNGDTENCVTCGSEVFGRCGLQWGTPVAGTRLLPHRCHLEENHPGTGCVCCCGDRAEVTCASCGRNRPVTAGYGAGVFCAGCLAVCREAPSPDHVCVICASPEEARKLGISIPAGWRLQ